MRKLGIWLILRHTRYYLFLVRRINSGDVGDKFFATTDFWWHLKILETDILKIIGILKLALSAKNENFTMHRIQPLLDVADRLWISLNGIGWHKSFRLSPKSQSYHQHNFCWTKSSLKNYGFGDSEIEQIHHLD